MSNIIPLPPLDPDPAPPSAPLMLVACKTCLGDGWLETPETGYRCPDCDGGYVERCSGCLQAPTVDERGYERCGCPEPELTAYRPCEACERLVLETELDAANVCESCRRTGLETVIAEDDPYYRAWVAEQLELGRQWGWL